MALGRTPARVDMIDIEHAQQAEAIRRTRDLVRAAARQHTGNLDLVNLALDVENELAAVDIPIIPGR